jgi:hypothetical protein
MLVHDDGAFVIWIPLEGEKHAFEIADTPGNSPRFNLHFIDYDPVKLREHVLTELQGWNVIRWNLDENCPGETIPWSPES